MEAVVAAAANPERSSAGGGGGGVVVVVVPGVEQQQPSQRQEAAGESSGARVVVGNTCHQCRQKIRGLAASCKQVKIKGKLCPIKYCHKCLPNRYGENVEEATRNEAWTCPKCRGICNCSLCMKKKGLAPTGILAHTAKASGCGSVHELLEKGNEVVAALQNSTQKVRSATLNVPSAQKKNPKRALEPAAADEPLAERDENVCIDFNAVSSTQVKKKLKKIGTVNNGVPLMKDQSSTPENHVVLPRGTLVTSIAGVELDPEDVGPALQFIEFCRTFAEGCRLSANCPLMRAIFEKVLFVPGRSYGTSYLYDKHVLKLIFQIRKGQPEKILHSIAGGRGLRVVSSLVAEFHINLLSIIQEGKGMKPVTYSRDSDAWIVDVGKCISESSFVPKEMPLDSLSRGVSGYKNLSASCKIRVLNYLCDESLSAEKSRSCMLAEKRTVSKEKVFSAKEKEKEPKEEEAKNDTDEATNLNAEGAALTIAENKNTVSQIKELSEVKHAAINATSEKKHESFLRIKPVMVEKGAVYWKLDGYCNNTTMMLQEVDADDVTGNKEKWFVFNEDEQKIVEDYVSTRLKQQRRKHACTVY